ncbi:hypothetical protein GCM10007108_02270 [Thermogymnomonas acidicola]|uniref:Uncharacterized protein n=1 Tax=Thermogymnomonas acidicola TaxID=399579 RepID=A0AA37BQ09_9ARCH|nr:hypothetical protein [Thermogymnomonas acidicola]GGM67768.1 hypothetical protein GCM10007108_02270 [Thermogymnomonas acidicola]
MPHAGTLIRERPLALVLGIALMVCAILVQEVLDLVPLAWFNASSGSRDLLGTPGYLGFEIAHSILISLYLGLVAGICQELLTLAGVRFICQRAVVYFGLGFSVVDVLLLVVQSIPSFLSLNSYFLFVFTSNIAVEATLHPGSAALMKWSTFFSRARVLGALLLCIILHAGIDGGLVFTDIFSITHRASAEMAGTLYLSVSVIISVALFAAGYWLLRSAPGSSSNRPH